MSNEAVLFDLDNTFYPYAPCDEAGRRAAFEAVRGRGYDVDRAAFDDLYAAARREAKRELGGTAASHGRLIYAKRLLRDHADVHDAADALAVGDAYWEGFLSRMEPFDGVEQVLRSLREAGRDVAVVTNLTTRIQLRKLDRLGVDGLVDRVVTSEEVGREKPSALPFTTALSGLDRRPSEAVVVGDNVAADVGGGNAVGTDTVLFTGGSGDFPETDELAEPRRPDHRVDEFAALTEVLG